MMTTQCTYFTKMSQLTVRPLSYAGITQIRFQGTKANTLSQPIGAPSGFTIQFIHSIPTRTKFVNPFQLKDPIESGKLRSKRVWRTLHIERFPTMLLYYKQNRTPTVMITAYTISSIPACLIFIFVKGDQIARRSSTTAGMRSHLEKNKITKRMKIP